MNNCRHCKKPIEAKAWQVLKSDFECAPCRRARQAAWRATRKAEGRPVVSPQMQAEYHRAYQAKYFQDEANREKRNARMREYAKAHGTRDHHAARWQVSRAIKAGRLQRQPCEVCGSQQVHAHHDNYDKPLDVRWLCPHHHREHHAKATGGDV